MLLRVFCIRNIRKIDQVRGPVFFYIFQPVLLFEVNAVRMGASSDHRPYHVLQSVLHNLAVSYGKVFVVACRNTDIDQRHIRQLLKSVILPDPFHKHIFFQIRKILCPFFMNMLQFLEIIFFDVICFQVIQIIKLRNADSLFLLPLFPDKHYDLLFYIRKNQLFKCKERNLGKMIRQKQPEIFRISHLHDLRRNHKCYFSMFA